MQGIKLLISVASNIIYQAQLYLNQTLKEKDLSSAETNVLMFLYNNGDGVNQDTIVAGVDVSKPAISRTINSLESKGYLLRQASSDDKRARLVCLTAKARQVEDFVQGVYADFVSIAAAGIPAAKVEEFTQLMQGVAENIEAYLRTQDDNKD